MFIKIIYYKIHIIFSLLGNPVILSDTQQNPTHTSFHSYLADTDTSFEMLDRYPILKSTFMKFNAPLPSSAAVERLFSFATLLNNPRRGSLSDGNFEKLLLLKANRELTNVKNAQSNEN